MSTLLERMNESLEAVTLVEKKESEKKDYDHMKKVMAEYKKKVDEKEYDDMDGEVDKMTEEKYKEMKEKCASYDKDQKTNESLNDRIKNVVSLNESKGDDGDGKIENEAEFKSSAKKILKKAHGDDYDEDEANEMIASLIKKYGKDGDWSDAIGVVQNSLGD